MSAKWWAVVLLALAGACVAGALSWADGGSFWDWPSLVGAVLGALAGIIGLEEK